MLPVLISGTCMAVRCIWCHIECTEIGFTAETEQTIERVIYIYMTLLAGVKRIHLCFFCPLNLAPGLAFKRNS